MWKYKRSQRLSIAKEILRKKKTGDISFPRFQVILTSDRYWHKNRQINKREQNQDPRNKPKHNQQRRAWQPSAVFLPGEFPSTEEPGRLRSLGSQRAALTEQLSTYSVNIFDNTESQEYSVEERQYIQ